MDENSTMESSSLPIIEQNENFLSTVVTSTEFNDKVMTTLDKEREENILLPADTNISSSSNLNYDQSPQIIISIIIDDIIRQIDANINISSASSDEQKHGDSKTTTRTLRSHAKRTLDISILNQTSNNKRRVSNRRRILKKKLSLDTNERPQRKKTISERSQNNETSSNSDDQTIENIHDKIDQTEDTSMTEDDGNNLTHSTINIKQIHRHPDIDSLPPNKRRLRERNAALLSSTDTSTTINSCSIEENLPIETTKRDIPTNSIKQFLEIRQQVG
jgi:hypothetical protein